MEKIQGCVVEFIEATSSGDGPLMLKHGRIKINGVDVGHTSARQSPVVSGLGEDDLVSVTLTLLPRRIVYRAAIEDEF